MLSAFGIDHGNISKMGPDASDVHSKKNLNVVSRKVKRITTGDAKIPKAAYFVTPGSVIRAYDDSRAHKVKAAGKQYVSAAGGGLAGTIAGGAAAAIAMKKVPGIKRFAGKATKIGRVNISADKKAGALGAMGASMGAGVGTSSANLASLQHTKRDPQYKFRS